MTFAFDVNYVLDRDKQVSGRCVIYSNNLAVSQKHCQFINDMRKIRLQRFCIRLADEIKRVVFKAVENKVALCGNEDNIYLSTLFSYLLII